MSLPAGRRHRTDDSDLSSSTKRRRPEQRQYQDSSSDPFEHPEVGVEQAQSILANELYRFAHKRSIITPKDFSAFMRKFSDKRPERKAWQSFYRREHEVIDNMLRDMGLDPKGWHDHPPKTHQ
ncbi:hypothetical protein V865_001895 [Kwoniella europaea PYCC6329]|uniref:Uncharacterized protein n=1 Tax=Kwoniella europaea PYCC6329 TaxID=1423913 RepID=A0AAX4KCW7_9TREE